jgi:hypothetical protein
MIRNNEPCISERVSLPYSAKKILRELTDAVDQYRLAKQRPARQDALTRYYKAWQEWDDMRRETQPPPEIANKFHSLNQTLRRLQEGKESRSPSASAKTKSKAKPKKKKKKKKRTYRSVSVFAVRGGLPQ